MWFSSVSRQEIITGKFRFFFKNCAFKIWLLSVSVCYQISIRFKDNLTKELLDKTWKMPYYRSAKVANITFNHCVLYAYLLKTNGMLLRQYITGILMIKNLDKEEGPATPPIWFSFCFLWKLHKHQLNVFFPIHETIVLIILESKLHTILSKKTGKSSICRNYNSIVLMLKMQRHRFAHITICMHHR